MIRPLLVLVHRWAGLVLAGPLLLAGLTGSLLAFGDELDSWLNPQPFRVSPGPSLPLEQLVERVGRAEPRAKLTWIGFPTRTRSSLQMGVASRDGTGLGYDQIFVDPVNGELLGRRDSSGCCFAAPVLVPFLFRLHSMLALGRTGQWVMAGAAVLWCLDCFAALWLTFPRTRPFFKRWRPAWGIKYVPNSFRLVFKIHRAGGLWCWVFLLLLAVSAVALTLRTEVFLPVLRLVLPVTPDIAAAPAPPSPTIDLAAAVVRAKRALPGKRPAVAYLLPNVGIYSISMTERDGPVYAGLGPDVVFVAASDGRIVRIDQAASGLAGDKVLALQYALHSGHVAGLPSRILVSALGLAVAVLSLTGPWVWWRKRRVANLARIRRKIQAHELSEGS